ncbi:uncharacterized protein LOC125676989 [Ostrea edulis]|uniref:uncharacterized protein LOC125676989 n=1 Tax=Ostrea edulis TaxID=37623 RepID=UPI0020964EDF|nr:uncharacterized protein LOC125676989 [Ostrea edulis]XP_048770855.1 uncharacterized protein LOC125676989 [Ostrea edulis]XP_048770856.1 uncharacterized protein LOC125676989 [Ostrea edulis]
MPSLESPSFSSSRIQRAYRINNIEYTKLQGKLNLLEKEKIHSKRVINQDIRLISLTLDYINNCSGHSPEGLAPDSEEEYERLDEGPCFMYGERIVSRKKRRFKRSQSAAENSRSSGSLSSIPSLLPPAIRPQSSPVGRATFVTTLQAGENTRDTDPYSDKDSLHSESSSLSWMSGTSSLTRKLIKASRGRPRRESLHEKGPRRVRSLSSANIQSLTRQLMPLDGGKASAQDDRRASTSLARNAGITEILNQRRPTVTADAWKSHLTDQTKSGAPMTMAAQRQRIMGYKLQINEDRKSAVNQKFKDFMKKTS